MTRKTILAVDDEEDVLELLKYNLEKNGYQVATASTGEQALRKANSILPSLVLLDLMLPGIDGLEVCKQLKGNPKTEHIPVIMLTAKGEESDVVVGLEVGAEDYITKPFSPKVLVARIRGILHRSKVRQEDAPAIKIHEISIDPSRHEVLVKGKKADMTFTEFKILQVLARRPGLVFTRYQIVDAIHGSDYLVTERAVDVQIVSLRRKLGSCGKYIETVRGIGYRFKD